MNRKTYRSIKKYWKYLHPLGRIAITAEFNGQRIFRKKNLAIWSPRILSAMFLGAITLYTFFVFLPDRQELIDHMFFYFLPSIFVLVAIFIAWKHHNFGGLLFLAMGIVLFFPYQVKVGFMVYVVLTAIGILFIIQNNEKTNRFHARKGVRKHD